MHTYYAHTHTPIHTHMHIDTLRRTCPHIHIHTYNYTYKHVPIRLFLLLKKCWLFSGRLSPTHTQMLSAQDATISPWTSNKLYPMTAPRSGYFSWVRQKCLTVRLEAADKLFRLFSPVRQWQQQQGRLHQHYLCNKSAQRKIFFSFYKHFYNKSEETDSKTIFSLSTQA